MKYIQKSAEPTSLSTWKIKQGDKIPTWKSFGRTVVKGQLLETLLKEQGYICCYCGVAIDKGSCHIEHFKPQGKDETVRFDYSNLDEDFNEEEIRNIIKDYLELNNDGKYQPFCATIVYILENYYL
jgi:hypothetical protein